VCTLYPFFDPLAQLIAEQFGIAEVNKIFLHYDLSNTRYIATTADDSDQDQAIAGLFVYVVNQKVNWKLIRKFLP